MTDDVFQPAELAIRSLRREVAQASDPKILRVVATVEAAAERGPADDLIAPIRPRLAILRPPRRLRFSRLLFHPLGPLIVPAARWRPAEPAVPRTVVTTIAEHVRTTMGHAARSMEAAVAQGTTADTELIERIGRTLWPKAAQILVAAMVPDRWNDATGLDDVQFRKLARMIAAVLSQAPALEDLCQSSANGRLLPETKAVWAMVRGVGMISEAALPMMISVMLMRLPQTAGVLKPYPGPRTSVVHAALNQAAEMLVKRLEVRDPNTWITPASLAETGAEVRRITDLLAQLEDIGGTPVRKSQCAKIRHRLADVCSARFKADLQTDLLAPLHELTSPPRPGFITDLEATARALRVLQTEARPLGGDGMYGTLLSEVVETLKSAKVAEQIGLPERTRLVEILAGSDVALAMLRNGF